MMKRQRSHSGFTLIELIVAMGLGLTFVAGTVVVFIQTSRSTSQDDEIARVLENGRFVMRFVSRELAMAGFWGKFLDIETATDHLSATVGTECGDGVNPWILELDALQFLNDATTATTAATFGCLPSADIVAGSDIFAVKRVADAETLDANIVSSQMYMRTNGVAAQMFRGAGVGTPPALGGTEANWAYFPQVFYLRNYSVVSGDGIPTLCRAALDSGSPPDMRSECLVEGVENIQIEFGVDDDDDFIANYYTATPTAVEIFDSVSVRLYVLVRGVNEMPNYTNDKTYIMGSTTIAAANDGFFRRVFSTTVVLRNPANLTGLDS